MMPAATPPHRETPDCPAEFRAELVELAIAGEPGLVCDRRELDRPGPSYTYDSLRELRTEFGAGRSLCLVVGADAVAALDTWHRWRELVQLAHLVVIARPGWQVPESGAVAGWLEQHMTTDASVLQREPAGHILLQQLRPLDISSTEIRHMIAAGRSPRYLVPDVVWQHIQDRALYGYRQNRQE